LKLLAVSCLGSFLLTLLPYRRGCCGGSCARLYGRVSEFGAVLRSPQSPRRTLDDLIIPVRGAGLARVRVCLEGVGRGDTPPRTAVMAQLAVHPNVDEGRSTSVFTVHTTAILQDLQDPANHGTPQKVAGICHVGSRRHRLLVPNPRAAKGSSGWSGRGGVGARPAG